jgi:hypothetical protein
MMMKLLCDDLKNIYVWVDEKDESVEYSPHYDYEEDADQWMIRQQTQDKGLNDV